MTELLQPPPAPQQRRVLRSSQVPKSTTLCPKSKKRVPPSQVVFENRSLINQSIDRQGTMLPVSGDKARCARCLNDLSSKLGNDYSPRVSLKESHLRRVGFQYNMALLMKFNIIYPVQNTKYRTPRLQSSPVARWQYPPNMYCHQTRMASAVHELLPLAMLHWPSDRVVSHAR